MKFAVSATFLLSALPSWSGDLPAGPPGRYQLFHGEYTFVNIKGEGSKSKELFLLDTATGKMFLCESRQWPGSIEGKPNRTIQHTGCEPFERHQDFPRNEND